jgi:predicted acylesterase/phospholipase RssA
MNPLENRTVTPDVSTEEIRVAMALNGGVSLAVWMGGCAVELDCARRAHLATPAPAPTAEAPRARIYNMLCSSLDRELVIDIMSGASAGGINGALLAAVISHGRKLDPDFVRDRWIDLGDFSGLLQPLSTQDPRSLMSGAAFHSELLKTFEAVLGTSEDDASNNTSALPSGQRPAELEPVLDVTTTNLVGEERLFVDSWGETLAAREYRACFRFREYEDYTAENLAIAARASASFPLAFEPWKVAGNDPCRLADFPISRWVVDGGLLDNAPIRLALQAIPARPANRQVKRFVCYVNGDPPENEARADGLPPEPTLEGVISAIVDLPRKAPFADELKAIETASRRSSLNRSAVVPLLAIDLTALVATAQSLLPVYRGRRRLSSLQDILSQPRDAEKAFERIDGVGELPWIPTSLDAPAPGSWGWGIETARRIHHLALDLIRMTLPEQLPGARHDLLVARIDIDARLRELDGRQEGLESSPCVVGVLQSVACGPEERIKLELASLAGFVAPHDAALYESVRNTAIALYGVAVQLGARDGVPIGLALFGPTWVDSPHVTDEMVTYFIQRSLAIEVVRRAFSVGDVVEDAQQLAFAQLTPFAPTPILSAEPSKRPLRIAPKQKLTGVALGHFGAFYRGSWRANDFMWGRLDAASRIVNMLLDSERAKAMQDRDEAARGRVFADSLLEGAGDDQRWLIEEALDDAECVANDDLAVRLRESLEHDLTRDEPTLTRTICIRAAQLEILREELPHVLAQALQDEQKGSSPNALGLAASQQVVTPEGMITAIKALRTGECLPARLGLDTPREAASTLAIRTIARSGLVSLAVMRDGVRFAQPLQILRALLLPVSGVVAQHWRNRLAVVLAFVASAWFLAGRTVTTMTDKPADLAHLSLLELLATVIAILVVIGTSAVPIYRLVYGNKADWAVQGLWVLLLLGTGFGATIALAAFGHLNAGQLIVQPGARSVPKILLLPAGLIVLGIVLVPVPFVRSWLAKIARQAWGDTTSWLLAFIAAVCLIGWAQAPLRHAVANGQRWQSTIALVAIFGAPFAAGAFLLLRDPVNRLRASK